VVCYLCPHERDQSGGWVLKFAPDPSWGINLGIKVDHH